MSKILYFTVSAVRTDGNSGGSQFIGSRKSGLVTLVKNTGIDTSSYVSIKTSKYDRYLTHLYKDWYTITSVFIQYEDGTKKTTHFKKDEIEVAFDYIQSLVNVFKEQEGIPQHKSLTIEDYKDVPDSAFVDESTYSGTTKASGSSTYKYTTYTKKKPSIFFLRRKDALPKEELEKTLKSIT